ncbi:hypothetical protein HanRHA438_Chr08g0346271 [Helianthus annuus]|uniref:Uncharacterized protein n=1 Tax=Helianthus annuus TaxID=4232 RepID=A0A251U5K4_HELAN|nr:hypothetical protein HanXRQr2_Chr08g0334871 [Helianthus annuus]KAJ0553213.1 hypothetical protein HanHA89_Chr08g0293961 [Helianthus annuus]KAJ0722126.1 hypothetical protein HanOQP8_Chr08g0283221 [Helianthus annuus]KAJ0897485.1 hypothetical protein HanRHA438_Chr08g0346271 [Helianthus annuus]
MYEVDKDDSRMFVCLVDKDGSAYNAANSCKRLCLFIFPIMLRLLFSRIWNL